MHCSFQRTIIYYCVTIFSASIYAVSNIDVDCGRMVYEGKKQLEVTARMDSLDEGRPLRYESSVYVFTPLSKRFLPCDAMHIADYAVTRCPSVCLSVRPAHRPSVTRRYCVKTAKHIIKLFTRVSTQF